MPGIGAHAPFATLHESGSFPFARWFWYSGSVWPEHMVSERKRLEIGPLRLVQSCEERVRETCDHICAALRTDKRG
jgi:hypothetical protein